MNWWVHSSVADLFPSLKACSQVEGEEINGNWMSRVVRVSDVEGVAYYVKVYASRGRWLKRFLGRSRVRAEWENQTLFHHLNIPAAELVAYGEAPAGPDYLGAVVTKEVRGTSDLDALYRNKSDWFSNRQWRLKVIREVARATRMLHQHGFVHNDLKWRNILVDTREDPGVYLIDCPLGRRAFGPLLGRGKVKDLACLDRHGKIQLSRSDRLRFYLAYKARVRLDSSDKEEIRRVLRFFEGRERQT